MLVKKGFTLVELSLSLAFIAVLSLTIALIITSAVSSYRRGLTLKQVNTVGIELVDDMRAAIQSSSTKSVKYDCGLVYTNHDKIADCENTGARNFVSLTRKASVVKEGSILTDVPVYGAFCTGTYTYIWNSGYFFSEAGSYRVQDGIAPAKLKFKIDGGVENNKVCVKDSGGTMSCSNFKLLKIKDSSRAACVAMTGNSYTSNISNEFNIITTGDIISETPIDLLATDEVNGGLALYNLAVSGPVESAAEGALFYSVSFVLGTVQGGANIMKPGGFCSTPEEYADANFDYCSINKFNFAAEATGV